MMEDINLEDNDDINRTIDWEDTAEKLKQLSQQQEVLKELYEKLSRRSSSTTRRARTEEGKEVEVEEDTTSTALLERSRFVDFLKAASKRSHFDLSDKMVEAACDELLKGFPDAVANASASAPNGTGGGLTLEDFQQLYDENPELFQRAFLDAPQQEELSVRQQDQIKPLSERELQEEHVATEQAYHYHPAWLNWKNATRFRVWMLIYAGLTALMFWIGTWNMNPMRLKMLGSSAMMENGAAYVINFNAAFLLLIVARRFVTWIRAKTWARFIFFPYDAALDVHMTMGYAILIFSIIHSFGAIMDYKKIANNPQAWKGMIAPKNGWDPNLQTPKERMAVQMKSMPSITGILMWVCLILAYVTIPLKRKYFNTFWYSHHWLIVMLALMCVHGTSNWVRHFQTIYWLAIPASMYLIPRLWREVRCKSATVSKVKVHGINENILELRVEKPKNYAWKSLDAGMYANINISSISWLEWHPMTMSTGPNDDYVGFHIQCVGDWTNKSRNLLREYAVDESLFLEEGGEKEHEQVEQDLDANDKTYTNNKDMPMVRIEGPFGAPAQTYGDHQVVVLVGAGIGITPMISVLDQLLQNPGKIKHAFFYWTTRDASTFAMFDKLMEDIYEKDTNNILEIRHFLTSAKPGDDRRDLGAILLHHAANSIHNQTEFDIVLGHHNKNQVQVGRPKWPKELAHIKTVTQQGYNENKCCIFFCGANPMAKAISDEAKKLSDSNFSFDFNKETF